MAQQTALHDVTAAAGARFGEEAGWLVPAQFGDPQAEYREAKTGTVIFDLSHRGKIEVAGKDAASFLHNLSTNDIRELGKGKWCEAFLATNKARAIAYVRIHHMVMGAESVFLLDLDPGFGDKVLKHLDHHLISEKVELTDRTAAYAAMHLAGPRATEVLKTAIDDMGKIRERPSGGMDCHLVLAERIGLPGYDIFCAASHAETIWRALTAAGAKPAGLDAFEVLRVEAGTPVYGKDIDDERFVVELDRPNAICYTKGCYLGQEPIVMARDRGHVNRHFRGLRVSGEPLAPNTKLLREGTEVGQVTSAVSSPRFGSIGLGYLRRGSETAGTQLEAETPAGRTSVTVSGLPFTDSGGGSS